MTNEELSPMPEPYAEEPQLVPGGVDALEEDPADAGLARDLDPDDNPAVDDVLPDEVAQPDEKSQAPEGEAEDKEPDTTRSESDGGPSAAEDVKDDASEPSD
jgi:hypothetical protein